MNGRAARPAEFGAESRGCFEQLLAWLEGGQATGMTHAELEDELVCRGRELLRRMLQDHHLTLRAATEPAADRVADDAGVVHAAVETGHRRRLASVFGQVLARPKRAKADQCAKYLINKAKYLDYATALASGWPIATGIIESACRYLVADRMNITGAHWSGTAPKPCSSYEPPEPTATSRPTGDTTSTENNIASTDLATPTNVIPLAA